MAATATPALLDLLRSPVAANQLDRADIATMAFLLDDMAETRTINCEVLRLIAERLNDLLPDDTTSHTQRRKISVGDKRHGTLHAYRNLGCRCSSCRAVGHETDIRLHRRGLAAGDPRHGLNGYTHFGCRCDVCSTAMKSYYRDRTRPAGVAGQED